MKENTNECLYCGESFTSKRSDAKYCCNSHRQLAYLKKGEDRLQCSYNIPTIGYSRKSQAEKNATIKAELQSFVKEAMAIRQREFDKKLEEMRLEDETIKKETAFNFLSRYVLDIIKQLLRCDNYERIAGRELKSLLSSIESLSRSEDLEDYGAKFPPEVFIRVNIKPFLENVLASLQESRERHIEFELPVNFKQQFVKISDQLQG